MNHPTRLDSEMPSRNKRAIRSILAEVCPEPLVINGVEIANIG